MSPTAYRVAARFLAEQTKSAPKKVDDLQKEVKRDNPGYTDEQAWATAWSIYCKHVDPGGEHCNKSPGEYLKKDAAGESDDVGLFKRNVEEWEDKLLDFAKTMEGIAEKIREIGETVPEGMLYEGTWDEFSHAASAVDDAAQEVSRRARRLG